MQTEYNLTHEPANKMTENNFLDFIKTNITAKSEDINQQVKLQNIKKITVTLKINKADMIPIHDLFKAANSCVQSGILKTNENWNICFYHNKEISSVFRDTEENIISCLIVFHDFERIFGPLTLNYISEKNLWRILFKKAQKVWDNLIPLPENQNHTLINDNIKYLQSCISYKAIHAVVITTHHEVNNSVGTVK